MKPYKYFLFLSLFISSFNLAFGNFENLTVHQFLVENGLSSNLVEQVVKDNSGFLWIATSKGLNQFDGDNFFHYKHIESDESSLSRDYVRCLFVDPDNNIWVGTKGGGLNYFNRATGKFKHYLHDQEDESSISDNEILDIFRDSKGRLWIGTENGLNLFDDESQTFRRFLPDETSPNSVPAKAILKIFEDQNNHLWIGSWDGGLSFVEEDNNKERMFSFHSSLHDSDKTHSIGSNHCWEIEQDKNGHIWVGLFNSGASLVWPTTEYEKGKADEYVKNLKFINYKQSTLVGHTGLAHHNVLDIKFTDTEEILFATTSGLSVLDYTCIDFSKSYEELNAERESINFFKITSIEDRESLFEGTIIRSILQIENGKLWLSTYDGLSKTTYGNSRFKTFFSSKNVTDENFDIRALQFTDYGYYLLATDQGLYKFDHSTYAKKKIIGYESEVDKKFGYVSYVFEDRNRNIWLGTNNGLFRRDKNTEEFYRYSDQLGNNEFFNNKNIDRIYEDKLGHIWICYDFGFGELDPKNKTFTIHGDMQNDPYGLGVQGVSGITEDEKGRLWFSHLGLGILKFERVNGQNTFESFGLGHSDPEQNLTGKFAKAIDYKDGIIWLGTEEGISSFDINTNQVTNYNSSRLKESLKGGIHCLGVDNESGIWISCNDELICFDRESGNVGRYDYQNGLPGRVFNNRAFHKSSSGKLSFGTPSGFVTFYGETIPKQIHVPAVTLTNLSVVNFDENSNNQQASSKNININYAKTVNLTHEDSQFSIGFGVLDSRLVNKYEYAYKIVGLNNDWMYIGTKNSVTFTGLAPNKYTFKVKAKNQDGYWSREITSVDIVITGPWYSSWEAILGFVLLLLLLSYMFYIRKNKIAMKEKIQLEMLVKDRTAALRAITIKEKQARIAAEMMKDEANDAQQRAEAANLAKSQFLANMSHEIRTPMNGILGMLQLLNNTELNTEQSDYVRTSTESALGLIRIINDILDFSKVESNKIEIETEKVNIHTIIENVIDLNAANCQEKHIEISYLIEPTVPRIIIGDEVRIRQILTNLVSNAIKFTSRGEITMVVSVDPSAPGSRNNRLTDLKFVVNDTGIGISKDKISQLFQAFSQVDASITRKFGGTGLGLAISRKLARLMNGDVKLESKQGVGTEVTFTLSCEFDSTSLNMRNNQFQIQNKSVAIITKSAVGGKSLVNILETAGIHSFSITREITGEFLDDLIKNPVDVLFVDSAFFTPSTEIHLNRVKDETNTKIILNVPILFPSLETKCIDAATSKPFKKANVLSTLHSIFHESAVSIHTSQENPESLHRSGKKGIGRDVFNDKFAQTSPLNILVAEDHKINQMLIKKVLSKLGYNPVIVENGKLAIEESLNTTYDVIFMDIQMPVLDGIAATKEIIKNWETHQKPFIIAMTANAMKGDREKYISSGMHDYISKPFLINDLLNMLKKYSEKKQSQIKNASLPRN